MLGPSLDISFVWLSLGKQAKYLTVELFVIAKTLIVYSNRLVHLNVDDDSLAPLGYLETSSKHLVDE